MRVREVEHVVLVPAGYPLVHLKKGRRRTTRKERAAGLPPSSEQGRRVLLEGKATYGARRGGEAPMAGVAVWRRAWPQPAVCAARTIAL